MYAIVEKSASLGLPKEPVIDESGINSRIYFDEYNVLEHSSMWRMEKFKETLYNKKEHKSGLFQTTSGMQYFYSVSEVDHQLYDIKGDTFISVPHIKIRLQVCGYSITDINSIWLELSVHSSSSQANFYNVKDLFNLSKVSRDKVFVNIYVKKCEIMSKNYVVDGAFTLKSKVKEIIAYEKYAVTADQ